MPTTYPDGSTLYSMKEALQICRISRSTYVRWLAAGKIRDTAQRDRNDWRLFSPSELEALKAVAFALNRTQVLRFEVR